MARAQAQRSVRCYLCGYRLEVSSRAMSTACPGCHKAIKIEDVVIKSYLPVVELQTCGRVTVTRRGRIAAQRIQCGDGVECQGIIEGAIETEGVVILGPKASWKGNVLQSRALQIAPGAKLLGAVSVPWRRPEAPKKEARPVAAPAEPGSLTQTAASSRSRTPTRRPARG